MLWGTPSRGGDTCSARDLGEFVVSALLRAGVGSRGTGEEKGEKSPLGSRS